MGFFNEYPYTNLHELNLDYILKKVSSIEYDVKNFIENNELSFKGEWSIDKSYPQNSIVLHEYNGYLAIKPVPSGVNIDNTDYWVMVIDYSQIFLNLDSRVLKNTKDIAKNTEDIAKNTEDIAKNTKDIAKNTEDIAKNTEDIAINTEDIAKNTSDITKNTEDIAENTQKIDTNIESINALKEELNNGFNYSLGEKNTNKKWIDGKSIYRKCYSLPNILAGVTTLIDADLNTSTIQNILYFSGCGTDSRGTYVPIPYHNESDVGYNNYWYMSGAGLSIVTMTKGNLTESILVVEYTKKIDVNVHPITQ